VVLVEETREELHRRIKEGFDKIEEVFPALRGRALALMPEKETWAKGALETLREVQSTLGIAKAKLMEVASVI